MMEPWLLPAVLGLVYLWAEWRKIRALDKLERVNAERMAAKGKRHEDDPAKPQRRREDGMDPELKAQLGELMAKISRDRHYGSPAVRRLRLRYVLTLVAVTAVASWSLYRVEDVGRDGRAGIREEQARADWELARAAQSAARDACTHERRVNRRIRLFVATQAPDLENEARAVFRLPTCPRVSAP